VSVNGAEKERITDDLKRNAENIARNIIRHWLTIMLTGDLPKILPLLVQSNRG